MNAPLKLRVLIVDDEPPARERLRSMLVEFGDFDVAGEAGNGEQALVQVDKLIPDIVLLDVRMPGVDGLEVARQLATMSEPPAVIFTTAFDEYALQAFDSQAIAYLLKPIRAEKLKTALAKAGRLTRPQLQQYASAAREPVHRSHVGVRGRDGLKLIPMEDVLCFHADQKYTTVKHLKGEDLIEDSLKTLEEEFSANFVRIHRNALVNTKYLERIARDASGQHFVHLRGLAEPLEVSRRMAGDLKDRFRI
jgi:two-component system response regulator AlgR